MDIVYVVTDEYGNVEVATTDPKLAYESAEEDDEKDDRKITVWRNGTPDRTYTRDQFAAEVK